jgi:cysteinyl-tRNA synthetase
MNRIANLDVSSEEPVDDQIFNEFNDQFKNVIANDLNTSLAITTLFDVLKYNVNDSTKIALLTNFDNVLDIGIKEELKKQLEKANSSKSDNISSEIYELANKRAELKKQKDYKQADEIRQKIIELGYEIVDTPNGPVISKNEI